MSRTVAVAALALVALAVLVWGLTKFGSPGPDEEALAREECVRALTMRNPAAVQTERQIQQCVYARTQGR